jgi:hypothetical protein
MFEKVDKNHDGTLTVSELAECLTNYPEIEIQELVRYERRLSPGGESVD